MLTLTPSQTVGPFFEILVPSRNRESLLTERTSLSDCPDGVPERDLPPDCFESTVTPGELFRKLDDWGHEAIVIPHGTTWGFYSPPGSSWDKQLVGPEHDPDRQTLIEVYSGPLG